MALRTRISGLLIASILIGSVSLMFGMSGATPAYAQESGMSRAEVVMSLILSRVKDIPAIRNTGQFRDVQWGIWHEPYMLYAERLSIISADSAGMLRPGSIVTRAEFLKMLIYTFGLPVNSTHSYRDVPTDSWFAPFAGLAEHANLFQLRDKSYLEPHTAVTRSEVQNAIAFFQKLKEDEENGRLGKELSAAQASGKLKLYTVISTRTQKIELVDPAEYAAANSQLVQTVAVSVAEFRTEILNLVNLIREQNGLPLVSYNLKLEQSSQEYADLMSAEGFFGHVSPSGQTLKDRVTKTGYYDRTFSADCRCVKGYALGENLARGQRTAEEAINAWMNSSSHRATILNPDYKEIGVGVSSGLWVQHFGGVLTPKE